MASSRPSIKLVKSSQFICVAQIHIRVIELYSEIIIQKKKKKSNSLTGRKWRNVYTVSVYTKFKWAIYTEAGWTLAYDIWIVGISEEKNLYLNRII